MKIGGSKYIVVSNNNVLQADNGRGGQSQRRPADYALDIIVH